MRYAIFSDVHANRQAWEAMLADALQQGADTLVCLGDVVGYGPKPLEVLTAVREATPNFVLGNHDAAACGRLDPSIFNDRARTVIEWTRDQLDEDAMQFLNQVPLQMDGSEIQFVHAEVIEPGEFGYVDGVGPAELNLKAMTRQLGFLGHTHLPLAFTMPRKGGQVTQLPPIDFDVERGKRYLVNVGSVGEPRTTDVRASYVVYDDAEKRVSFRKVAFDVEAYKADLAETGLDICPYFVQVVDAGKVAGAPEPTAAPQMALAHLPKVAEVVAGGHGHLVVGGPNMLPTGAVGVGAGVAVAQPKTISGPVIAAVAALVLGLVGLGVMVAVKGNKKDESETALAEKGDPKLKEPAKEGAQPESALKSGPMAVSKSQGGPIKNLTVWHFAKSFQHLDELRKEDEKKDKQGGEKVPGGMLEFESVGNEPVGMVWEGVLSVPETGVYELSLDASSHAALLLYWDLELETSASRLGDPKTTKKRLRKGLAPFRVEYIYREGDKGLALSWSGGGLDGVQSLIQGGAKSAVSIAQNTGPDSDPPSPGSDPTPPEPTKPEDDPETLAKRVAPEMISEGLLAYWSLDSREEEGSRFKQSPDGTVTEKLVQAEGQPVQAFVPSADQGRGWTQLNFDSNAWQQGTNGVGYEERAGEFDELIETRIQSEKDMHPHSVYVRIPFEVKSPDDYSGLALYMQYDDGFVAYLNGSQMASQHAPNPLLWNSGSTKKRSNKDVIKAELFKVGRSLRNLKAGKNVLAVQVLNHGKVPNDTNTGSDSSDLLLVPELVALRKSTTLPDEAKPKWFSPADRPVADKIKGEVKNVPGRYGEAYDFKGGSIEIGKKNAYAIADQSFSVSLWFTRDPNSADNQARRLISAGGGGKKKAGWSLWVMMDTGGVSFAVGDGNTISSVTAKKDSLANGEWHHVVATVDRESERAYVFLDGMLINDFRVPALKTKTLGASSGLSIGRNSDDEQQHRGKIDDIALWRRALHPEEVEKVFQSSESLGRVFDKERN